METTDLIPMLEPSVNIYTGLMSKNLMPNTPREQVVAIVRQEMENLNYLAMFKPEIAKCNQETIKYAMRKVIMQNLSFDPDMGLVFVTTRKQTVNGVKDVQCLEVKPSINGYISLYRQAGTLERINPTEVVYDDVTKQVSLVHVELVVPVHDAKGNITKNDILTFNFTKEDFKRWEKASHNQNMRGKKVDEINSTTLNCANVLYSNYYPLKDNAIHSFTDKGGIDPGFAITKCIGHALKRAKLDKNPNAKRIFGVVHERVVDSSMEEDETFYEAEDVTNEMQPETAAQTATQPEAQKQPEKPATPPAAATAATPPAAQQPQPTTSGLTPELLAFHKAQIDKCNTADEVTAYYIANQSIMIDPSEILTYLKTIGVKRRANPIAPPAYNIADDLVIIKEEDAKPVSKNVSANDL